MIGWDSKTFLHCKTNHYGRFFSNLLFSFPLPDSKECMAEEWNSPMRIHQSSYSKVENIPLCLCRVFAGFIGLLVKALTIGRRKLISRHRSGNVLSTTAAACAGCGHLDNISISQYQYLRRCPSQYLNILISISLAVAISISQYLLNQITRLRNTILSGSWRKLEPWKWGKEHSPVLPTKQFFKIWSNMYFYKKSSTGCLLFLGSPFLIPCFQPFVHQFHKDEEIWELLINKD